MCGSQGVGVAMFLASPTTLLSSHGGFPVMSQKSYGKITATPQK